MRRVWSFYARAGAASTLFSKNFAPSVRFGLFRAVFVLKSLCTAPCTLSASISQPIANLSFTATTALEPTPSIPLCPRPSSPRPLPLPLPPARTTRCRLAPPSYSLSLSSLAGTPTYPHRLTLLRTARPPPLPPARTTPHRLTLLPRPLALPHRLTPSTALQPQALPPNSLPKTQLDAHGHTGMLDASRCPGTLGKRVEELCQNPPHEVPLKSRLPRPGRSLCNASCDG